MALAEIAQMGIGVVQSLIGQGQINRANAKLQGLANQRVAYSTPDEVFDASDLALNLAQTGFGASTMNFYQNQLNRGLSQSIGAATRMGGDANTIADIYDRNLSAVMKIGAENESLQLKKFNDVYTQLANVANNLTAEWQSRDNLIKDKMQAQAAIAGAGQLNLQSGLNTLLGGVANYGMTQLYKEEKRDIETPSTLGAGRVTSAPNVISNTPIYNTPTIRTTPSI